MLRVPPSVVAVVLASLPLASCGGSGDPKPELALAQRPFGASGSGIPGIIDEVFVMMARSGDPTTLVGDTRAITAAEQGTSVSIFPSDDAQFAALAAILTNGTSDVIEILTRLGVGGGGGGSTGPESGNLQGLVPGVLNPDLAGYTLTRLEIRVDALSFSHPGGTTTYDFSGMLIVRGTQN